MPRPPAIRRLSGARSRVPCAFRVPCQRLPAAFRRVRPKENKARSAAMLRAGGAFLGRPSR
eukprot:11800050-Alexandrium_andersonii.AAC.1